MDHYLLQLKLIFIPKYAYVLKGFFQTDDATLRRKEDEGKCANVIRPMQL